MVNAPKKNLDHKLAGALRAIPVYQARAKGKGGQRTRHAARRCADASAAAGGRVDQAERPELGTGALVTGRAHHGARRAG